jgi:acyl-CoA synthetase (AMP-forming)/AMP-acid ligase II
MNALRAPQAVAVSYRGRDITFEELNRHVNRLAHGLRRLGLGKGERMASLFSNGLDIAHYYLAEAKIGVTIVALSPFWNAEAIVTAARDARVRVFAYDHGFTDLVASMRTELPSVEHWIAVGDTKVTGDATTADLLRDSPATEPEVTVHDDDEMAFYYTSGTTGKPKAVLHTHRSNLANSAGVWWSLPHGPDSVAASSTMLWGTGFPATLGSCLFAGMRTVLQEDMGPANFLKFVPAERITHAITRPSFWNELLQVPGQEDVDLGSLQTVLLGSEPLLPSLITRIRERIPGCTLWAYYGVSEAPFTCFGRADDGSQPLDASGRARTSAVVQVVDSGGERLTDRIGEIRIAGPHVMKEYHGMPEKTAAALRQGWFYTGDVGTQDERGVLRVLGRADEVIRRPGGWLLPAHLEDAVATLPAVAEAGAVGIPESAALQEVLLAVVPVAGQAVDEQELRRVIRQRLGDEATPEHVIVVDELPHLPEASGPGKLLRSEISKRLWDPAGKI